MISLEKWLVESIGLDLDRYAFLIKTFHKHQIFMIEDLYSAPKELVRQIIEESDIIMEEWEAVAFFDGLERLDSKIVVSCDSFFIQKSFLTLYYSHFG